jgi:hypothetical protein
MNMLDSARVGSALVANAASRTPAQAGDASRLARVNIVSHFFMTIPFHADYSPRLPRRHGSPKSITLIK